MAIAAYPPQLVILTAGCLAYRYGWDVLQLHAAELRQLRSVLLARWRKLTAVKTEKA
jgi:hypothetical protein